MKDSLDYDAVIIGGGFYGAAIAAHFARQHHFSVALIERENALLTRSSYSNQARIHNGYHYPRSFTTAFRSRLRFPNFSRDWPKAVRRDFTKLYAVARRNSKVTARQFIRFCHDIGARIEPADSDLKKLFDPRLIEDVFLVEECAFDARELAAWAKHELETHRVKILFNTEAKSIQKLGEGAIGVVIQSREMQDSGGRHSDKHSDGRSNRHSEKQGVVSSRYLFNCAYSGLNQLQGDFPKSSVGLKQEIAEIALLQMPPILSKVGITVMDGPFFSLLPFPPRGLHTLSHVRYTPHLYWIDKSGICPYRRLIEYNCETRVERMVRDTARYLPAILEAEYVESLFEIKTVLLKNESDDGRPILFERHSEAPGIYSILGGKIDNIYDVLERLGKEAFHV